MKNVNWGSALKRAAIFTGLWLGLVYVMHTFDSNIFQLNTVTDWITLGANAIIFFFLYTLMFGWLEKRRAEKRAQLKESKEKAKNKEVSKDRTVGDQELGSLRGQFNPNTSRRKVRRRRR